MIRAADFDGNIQDGLDEWVYFFKTAKVQGKFKAKGLAKAKQRLDIANLSQEERAEYDYYLESLRSEASYEAQLKFEAKKMADEIFDEIFDEKVINAYRKGNSIEVIANILEFSVEEVKEIIKNYEMNNSKIA